MDFLERILNCKDEELDEILTTRIQELTNASITYNGNYDVIGYEIDLDHQVFKDPEHKEVNFNIINNWIDYIPKGMKIVYGGELDGRSGFGSNKGRYFYMDSEDYLKDFCLYLRDLKPVLSSPYKLIPIVFDFLYSYLGAFKINGRTREEMHTVLVDKDGKYIEPKQGHGISDYKGNGAAMCTEYSAMTSNILCLFDFSTIFLCGKVDGEDHNFSMAAYKEDDYSLLDMANGVDVYNEAGSFCGKAPYMVLLDDFTQEDYDSFVYGKKHLKLDDFCVIKAKDKSYFFYYDTERDYSVDGLEKKKDPQKGLIRL